MWILGNVNVDVAVEGVTNLELQTQTGGTSPRTLFWGGGRIALADGSEISLASLPIAFDNAAQPNEPGKDFEGGPIKIAGVLYTNAVSAQPVNGGKPCVVRVDLSGLKARRFKAVFGGDYPRGDESQRRKTVAVRTTGTEARFLTVIEPYEDKSVVKFATASSPDALRVELADGRVQEITIQNLEGAGENIRVEMRAMKDGAVVQTETGEAR